MLSRNNVSIGISIGILIPMIALAFLFSGFSLYKALLRPDFIFNERTWTLVAVCFNMLLVQLPIFRSRAETKRGIAIVTMCLAIVWFLYYGIHILNIF